MAEEQENKLSLSQAKPEKPAKEKKEVKEDIVPNSSSKAQTKK